MPSSSPRVALIHATPLAIEPINTAFTRHWPQVERMNLLDDTLSIDRVRDGRVTIDMERRFIDLGLYCLSAGCTGILFTCSAFGAAVEAAGRASGVPTLKPNEAMFDQALALAVEGKPLKLGLVATFESSIASLSAELQVEAKARNIPIELRSVFVPEAMDDLAQGRPGDHHRKVAQACGPFADCDAVMLAQFSMAAAQPAAQEAVACPVLSSPDCAVLALKQRMVGHA